MEKTSPFIAGLAKLDRELPNDPQTGMRLRDYFAAKVLEALLADECSWTEEQARREQFDRLARRSYELADAMLREREKP